MRSHGSICEAYYAVYPNQLLQIILKNADDFYHRGNVRIHQSRYDEAFADFKKANEMEPNSHVIEFALAQFWFRYGGDKRRALIWINKAISHLGNESLLVQVIYQHLKTTICCGLKRYDEAVKSLQICTSALSEMIERLEWKNGQAAMEGGITIFGEGVRQSLSEAIEASEHLLALVNGNLLDLVQSILRVQKKLWRQL